MSYSRSGSRGRGGRSRSHSRDGGKRDLPGTVVRINERGFGFLEVDGQDDDIFFHSNDIVDNIDIRQLRVDDRVLLDLEPSKKKPGRFEGVNVRPEDPKVQDREKRESRRPGRYDDRRGGGRDYDRRGDRYDDRRGGRDRDYDRDRRGGGYGGGRDRYDDRRGGGRDYDRGRDRDRY